MVGFDTKLPEAVGGATAKAMAAGLDLHTVGDLLRHYPRRFAERGEATDLSALQVDDDVTVVAQVRSSDIKTNRSGRGARLEVVVGDGRGTLRLTFFGTSAGRLRWQKDKLAPGVVALFAGKVSVFNNARQLTHPAYELLDEGEDAEAVDRFAGALIPVYPATKEIRSWQLTKAVRIVLDLLDPIPDPVPEPLLRRHDLIDLDTALRAVHQPDGWPAREAALQRLKWDEALGVQLALAQRRAAAREHPATARPARQGGLLAAFDARLPFTLTDGQAAVGAELAAELSDEQPMHRLLQGEVGSGKTVVALRAMLQVLDSGGQAALLAPTEVLAAQHARSIESLLGPLAAGGQLGGADDATRVALLTGSLPAAARRRALAEAAGGAAGIVVGTHALIQEHVQFADLGLVVVDEQHRFGVEQRDALRSKAARPPHLLVMTATPIPRTVAMTVFGDLDTSVLRELPAGRSPIGTTVVPTSERPAWLDRAWQRIHEEVAAGRQAYVVCPRIGDGGSETDLDSADTPSEQGARRPPVAVLDVLAQLAEGPLHGLRLAALHGRLAADDKDRTMSAFAAGDLDVLVATTVIEVGVDVPNATVMVVLDADRFGVSQLHQLRGRVGRGGHAGICLLVSEAPLGTPARERLDAVASTTDGFELAQLDLAQRREGDVLGAAQSGSRRSLKLLSLLRDDEIILAARTEAAELVEDDPRLAAHPGLARMVAELVEDEQAEFLEKA